MTKCPKLEVPKECCSVVFGEGDYDHSVDYGETVRGEQFIIDKDKDGRILRIELLDSPLAPKPCQRR